MSQTVLERYSKIKYYHDSVKVQTIIKYTKKKKKKIANVTYRTFFIRNKYFELKGNYSSTHFPLEINSGVFYFKKDSISWIKIGDKPLEYLTKGISQGLARTVGGLGCKVNTIPILLLPSEVSGTNNLINYDTLEFLGDTTINNMDCYLIKAKIKKKDNKATQEIENQNLKVFETYESYYSIRKSDLLIINLTNKITYQNKIKIVKMKFYPIINNKKVINIKDKFSFIPY